MTAIRTIIFSALVIVLLLIFPAINSSGQSGGAKIVAGPFSSQTPGGPPAGWQRKDIKNRTLYSVIFEKEGSILQAESKNSASGLFRDVEIDPKQYQIMNWEWKVG